MNNQPLILNIAIPSPLRQAFDYLAPLGYEIDTLKPGLRIRVPFGRREMIGILIETSLSTKVDLAKLKKALAILDKEPLLPPTLMALAQWASKYYHHPIGDVMSHVLPKLLRQGAFEVCRQKTNASQANKALSTQKLSLNEHQEKAIRTIYNCKTFDSFLLDGVTGSGKTEVYLHLIEKLIAQNKQALVLVPEIGLTPQTVSRFQQRFSVPIAVLHSSLTDRERLDAWLLAKTGKAPIVIGTRSAIFTPMKNIGVIILDEEHDMSFKQQTGFRYSARDVAIKRAQLENIPIVLGSATPSLESLNNVISERFHRLTLPKRAGNAIIPKFYTIDLRGKLLEKGLSTSLLTAMKQHLTQQRQVLLFLNRRGYAPILLCHQCGWIAECKRCDSRMTLHQEPAMLHCHHCGSQRVVDQQCPQCQKTKLLPLGLGTARLEDTLKKYFPHTPLIRIDRDTTKRKGSINLLLETINQGNPGILIGTQMLAKGHHFPNVTLVAVIDADTGLFSADFRATERMAQLIIQVAGRSGRAEKPGDVLIQTYHPDHPLLNYLIKQGYYHFADVMLKERRSAMLPPFAYLALMRAESTTRNHPMHFLAEVKKISETIHNKNITLLGPVPAFMERRAGRYRAQLLLQTAQRSHLQKHLSLLIDKIGLLKSKTKVRWSIDVDPLEMF